MMGDFYNPGFFGGMFNFGWLFMLAFWGLVIWGIYVLARGSANISRNGSEEGQKDKEDPALAILKERYAKGEISKEEFEEKKKGLLS